MEIGNSKVRWWSSNYNLKEKIDFLKYRVASPKIDKNNDYDSSLNTGIIKFSDNQPNYYLVIIGDFMPVGKLNIQLSEGLRSFIDKSNDLIINMEGIASRKKRVLALNHNIEVLNYFRDLFTTNVIINVANNHAADFGEEEFYKYLQFIKKDFPVVGDCNNYILCDKINIYSASYWSNQLLDVVNKFNYRETPAAYLRKNYYNIFMPHWGYEMHLSPQKSQKNYAYKLLNSGWDAIIGSHTHCPQNIELYDYCINYL